jgi:hypothetical protein
LPYIQSEPSPSILATCPEPILMCFAPEMLSLARRTAVDVISFEAGHGRLCLRYLKGQDDFLRDSF